MTLIEQSPELDTRLKDFSKLLDSIESLDDKKKQLWREIYQNAILDRQNSYEMFCTLKRISAEKSIEHAVHGKTMATYIEKMSRANDQLIKLADLIAKAQTDDDEISPEEMFERIREKS
jgi:hypothetical protein